MSSALSNTRPNIRPKIRPNERGFTLIEIMIAVVLVAIIVAVALPSFSESIRKSRRSEAMASISTIQQAQERFRGNNANYAADLATLNLTTTTSTPGGYYALSTAPVTGFTATAYVVTADGSGGSQANDGDCGKLSVRMDGAAITYASCKACTDFTYTQTNRCWSR